MLIERLSRLWSAGHLSAPDVLLWLGRGALLAGAAFTGYHAYRVYYGDQHAFDDVLPWYALSFLLLFTGAANRSLLDVLSWPGRALAYARAHPLEMALLAGVVAMGVFVRVWRYGTLPPSNLLCCEEGINAGVASAIEGGARPLSYPLVRYSTVFGIWAFGDDTNGLRLPFVILGIASLVPFYLLMRELVRPPVALFTTAIFGSVHTLADTSVHFQPGIFASVVFALALVRGLKTANPLWWMLVGVLAAALSYEYESFKAVPLAAALFVAMALLWALVWPPAAPRALGERAWAIARRAWLPAIVFVLAIGIAITPMMARRHHGEHIYAASLKRQQQGREATGLDRYLSPQWEKQLRWVGEIYTPFVGPTFPLTGSIDARGVIDRGTSVLLLLSVGVAALGFWRPWRLLFLAWFVGASVALPLLVQNFGAWKLVPFLVPGIVLIGLLADDAWTLVQRRGSAVLPVLVFGLIAAVCFVFTTNVFIQRANATDPGVLAAYSIPDSETYAACHYLRGRPDDDFAYAAQWSQQGNGFALPLVTETEQRVAWQNHYFVCRGLEGTLSPSGEEVWPPPATSERPATIVLTGTPQNVVRWSASLARAMPGLGAPDYELHGPAGAFDIAGYELAPEDLDERRGVTASYTDAAGQAVTEVVDPTNMTFERPPAGAVELRALVRVPAQAEEGWALALSGTEGEVRIDGQRTSASFALSFTTTAMSLAEGWHVVEATLQRAGEGARLRWVASDGGPPLPLTRNDFFALPDVNGWLHTRSFGDATGPTKTVARFDFEPHVAHETAARALLRLPPPEGGWVLWDDTWSALWRVSTPARYVVKVDSPGSDVQLTVDGRVVQGLVNPAPDGSYTQYVYLLPLAAGDHAIEVRFRMTRGPFAGGTVGVTDTSGVPARLVLRPYR
ncbi:MAG: glycosyltransferase family 39 protein [Dehalococcoidia bacterium]